MYHIAIVSWGKDSLAMLLTLIAKGYPLNEVVFYDTGMEFEAIYHTRDQMLPRLEQLGIKYTRLEPENPFLFDMMIYAPTENGKKVLTDETCSCQLRAEQAQLLP